jgi:hypothetical protein
MLSRFASRASLVVMLLTLPLSAAQKQYEKGKIVDVQRKATTRILYYQVDTPITKDDPYYELSVQVNNVLYVGKYIPRHDSDLLPAEWQPGAEVDTRIDSHHIYLRKPSGVEIAFAIAKHTPVANDDTKKPAPNPDGK